ncbi:MAG: hypothetical protein ABIG69_06415 [Bacteroidota bacterium]
MKDFLPYEAGIELTKILKDKVVDEVEIDFDGMDDYLIFHFKDNTERNRY